MSKEYIFARLGIGGKHSNSTYMSTSTSQCVRRHQCGYMREEINYKAMIEIHSYYCVRKGVNKIYQE